MDLIASTAETARNSVEDREPTIVITVMSLGDAVRATQGGRAARNENKRQTYA